MMSKDNANDVVNLEQLQSGGGSYNLMGAVRVWSAQKRETGLPPLLCLNESQYKSMLADMVICTRMKPDQYDILGVAVEQ